MMPAPVGSVAFQCEPGDLFRSAQGAYRLADDAPEMAEGLVAMGAWYDELGLDMMAIRDLPEVER